MVMESAGLAYKQACRKQGGAVADAHIGMAMSCGKRSGRKCQV